MILESVKFVTFSLQIVIFAYVIRNLAAKTGKYDNREKEHNGQAT